MAQQYTLVKAAAFEALKERLQADLTSIAASTYAFAVDEIVVSLNDGQRFQVVAANGDVVTAGGVHLRRLPMSIGPVHLELASAAEPAAPAEGFVRLGVRTNAGSLELYALMPDGSATVLAAGDVQVGVAIPTLLDGDIARNWRDSMVVNLAAFVTDDGGDADITFGAAGPGVDSIDPATGLLTMLQQLGTTAVAWSATNTAGTANDAFNVTINAQVPAQFAAGDWSVAAGDGVANVIIGTLPDNGGAAITDIGYLVDGGAAVLTGGADDFQIALPNDVEADVQIYAVNNQGAGAVSAAKQVTPAVGGYTIFDNVAGTDVSIAGSDPYTLTGVGGDYDGAELIVSGADLDTQKALQIVPPVRLPDTDGGQTFNVRGGLYGATANIDYLRRWWRNKVVIPDFVAGSYTLQPGVDDYATIQYSEEPTTVEGGYPADFTSPLAAPYVVTLQEGYQDVGLSIDGATCLNINSTQHGQPDIQEGLIFASFIQTGTTGYLIDLPECQLRCSGANQIYKFGSREYIWHNQSGLRLHFLASISNGTIKAYYKKLGGTDAVAVAPQSTTGGLVASDALARIFTKADKSQFWIGTCYRFTIMDLSTTSVPDLDDLAVQALFWSPTTGAMQPPIVSQDALGDAASGRNWLDWYYDAAAGGLPYLNATGAYDGLGPGHYGAVNGGKFGSKEGAITLAGV